MKIEETKEIKAILPLYFQSCVNILEKHRNLGHFSAWSVGNADYLVSVYLADEALAQPQNGMHPYFDLASLTKPFCINALLRHHWNDQFQSCVSKPLHTFDWKKNSWNADLIHFIHQNKTLTWNTFLSHKSNFDAWVWCKFFISVRQKPHIKQDFFQLLLKHYTPKDKPVYSDLNYMFLALLIESLFDMTWEEQIKFLNEKQNTHFFHASVTPEQTKIAIPSYPYICIDPVDHSYPEKETLGFVHDTNANIFASLEQNDRIVSGHAGFYGNICDVFNGILTLTQTQPPMQKNHEADKFIYGLEQLTHNEHTTLGHFGYTGTSFWFNPKKSNHQKDPFVLLTNRTSHRTSEIKLKTPLVCIVTDKKKEKHHCFLMKNDHMTLLNQQDFLNITKKYFYNTEKFCDNSIILNYYNMTELRKSLATEIC